MIELRIPVEVPENRTITIQLPAEVPTGATEITLRIAGHRPQPIEVRLPPAPVPSLPRSGVVRER